MTPLFILSASLCLLFAVTTLSHNASAVGITATIKIGICGDGVVDTGEQCDGSDLNSKSCTLLGYTGGTLACLPSCEFDTASCNGASPAQVIIQSMGSVTVPNITANIRITNEGFTSTEYQYEWCVVGDINNACGGGNDTYFASAAKLIAAGQDFDTTLAATVPLAGTYYFKATVYYGLLSSAASVQFAASNPVVSNSGGGGGGGGPVATLPVANPTHKPSDFDHDGEVGGVDLSILLAFWKTSPPFKKPGVDLTKDNEVDATDLSILLYWWGK